MNQRIVRLLYNHSGIKLRVPPSAAILESPHVPAVPDPSRAVAQALARPIAAPPLEALLRARRPRTVAITVSDITRPVPNRDFLPLLLQTITACGVPLSGVSIIIGTGMHRSSTPEERRIILGDSVPPEVTVIDHTADRPETLVAVCDNPPVSVCRAFAQADFRIVTGYIEPHFMAGFSGGRKGVCPALVDLQTLQRFHGFTTLADARAEAGVLEGNPCHQIALEIAQRVSVDFLLNVAVTRDRRIAAVYCGDLEQAHQAGCAQVAQWSSAHVDDIFDLVITTGGGFPLDTTFYQTQKGMVMALPACGSETTLLVASGCAQQVGSSAFSELMFRWGDDWQGFLRHIAASDRTGLDQWNFQLHCRVLARIGQQRLWFVSDGIEAPVQQKLGVTPLVGSGSAPQRLQEAVDKFLAARPNARVAIIPDGPYTMLRR